MKITSQILDDLSRRAKESPRLRMNLDLRTSAGDSSQRMLNALELGTVLPIHRHRKSTETVVLIRGSVRQNYYDGDGRLIESFVAAASSSPNFASADCVGFSVPLGQWHNTVCLETGTVFIECKDGAYEPLSEEDVLDITVRDDCQKEQTAIPDKAKEEFSNCLGDLRKNIEYLIGMERHSGSMEVITPLYVSRMLNVPLEDVEKVMKDMNL